jgi:spermidine/putrescine transport system substrate-binding protein
MTDPFTNLITRRQLLRRAAAGGAALSLPSLLAACGGDGIEGQATTAQPGTTTVRQEFADTLVFANWPFYIDVSDDEKTRPTLDQFTQETGVKVRYLEEVNDNEEWFGKYQAQLAQGDDIGRDLVVLTDWMAARLIRLGYVEKKDKSAIPNEANLVASLRSPAWDPEREFTLPWQSGLAGIAYNKKRTGPVTTIDQLLTDPKLKGKVTMLTEMPDTMGVLMAANGDDPEQVTPEAFDRAIETLQAAVDSGQIRRFTGNEYVEDMLAENVWAALAWSGDVISALQPENPDIEFAVVDTGSHLWTDNMLIPTGGDVFTASTFMNFVYDPAIAAQIEAWVYYICPVEGAKEEMESLDEEAAASPLIFPPPETLENTFIFDAEASDDQDFKEKFQAVIGA